MKDKNLQIYIIGIMMLVTFSTNAQDFFVNGYISDIDDNQPLVGVNVVEVDKNGRYLHGTTTDYNGNYIIKISSGDAQIQFSIIGYEKQLLDINNRTRIDVRLKSKATMMDEITIVGKKVGNDGVIPIRDRAIAVSRIELKDLQSFMTTSVEEMLQGRLGNVDITAVSGDPGAGLNIRIRGTATLNARNSPLIVINGIPYDTQMDDFDFASADIEKFGNLIDVSPEDIESIEVLKDAGSTAIWGSRASNGVLMIKTKRGTKSEPVFEYTIKLTSAHEPDPIPMLDGGGYAKLIAESHYNLESRNEFFQSNPRAIEIAFDKNWEEYYNYAQNTNWIEEITRDALSHQHNFSVRGGGEKSRYNLSLGYQDENGTTINTSLEKLNIRTSFDYDLSSKLKFNSDVLFTRYDQDANYDYEDDFYKWEKSLRTMAYRKMPNLSVYVRDTNNVVYDEFFTPSVTLQGNADQMVNPVAFATLAKHKRIKDNLSAGFSVEYNIIPQLTIKSSVTLDIFDNKIEKFLPYKAVGYRYSDDITNKATDEYKKKTSIFNFTRIIYKPILAENHDVTFLGQFDAEATLNRGFHITTSRSASPFEQTTINKSITKMEALFSEYHSLGYYLNVHYKFKDKWILSLGSKFEGSSKYSREARWNFFPSTSIGWRVSEEWPLKNVNFINNLLLRGSWGKSGNNPEDNYLYFSTYSAGTKRAYLSMSGVEPNGIELTALRPEIIEQINLGFSFSAYKNRIIIEFDVYDKTTHDLYLKDSKIPSHSGFSTLHRNEGELKNKGIEFSIDYLVIDRNDFILSANFNIAHNQNIVISWPKNYSQVYGNMLENGNWRQVIVPGYAMGGFFGYNYYGAYPTTESTYVRDENGDYIYAVGETTPMRMIHGGSSAYIYKAGDAHYQDVNYDGKIDELDVIYLGDTNPELTGGFGPRIQIKNIVFNMFFYFRLGQEIINQTRIDTEKMYDFDNQSTATYQRWRTEGDTTDIPRALYNEGFNWLGSSRFVEDGSFIRLKTISISYNMPKKLIEKLKLSDMKIYLTGYNLHTWTNYSGQDPEVGLPARPDELPKDYSRTPPSIRYTLGLNIMF
ncbi:MAG: SusC/RagA family TonB-linked outer membrane protein [Bacteroidales bacterium]|nr:SusC/RagA family TonB-linked outer membrane protein [Bacteroidales bacterium]